MVVINKRLRSTTTRAWPHRRAAAGCFPRLEYTNPLQRACAFSDHWQVGGFGGSWKADAGHAERPGIEW